MQAKKGGGWQFNLSHPFAGERLVAFETHTKKEGLKCLHRGLAMKAWGSQEELVQAMSRGECWHVDVNGVQFIEWQEYESHKKTCIDNRATVGGKEAITGEQYETFKEFTIDNVFQLKLSKPEVAQMIKGGEIPCSITERISKAIVAMEKGFRTAENSFKSQKTLREEGNISPTGVDAMKTLAENIKACTPSMHRFTC